MLSRIKEQLKSMNTLSVLILRIGVPVACIALMFGLISLEYSETATDYARMLMPDNFGRVGVALFAEVVVSALFIDYIDKKRSN